MAARFARCHFVVIRSQLNFGVSWPPCFSDLVKIRMTEALEITTFRLVSGLTGADFVKANEDINKYLRTLTSSRGIPPAMANAAPRGS